MPMLMSQGPNLGWSSQATFMVGMAYVLIPVKLPVWRWLCSLLQSLTQCLAFLQLVGQHRASGPDSEQAPPTQALTLTAR